MYNVLSTINSILSLPSFRANQVQAYTNNFQLKNKIKSQYKVKHDMALTGTENTHLACLRKIYNKKDKNARSPFPSNPQRETNAINRILIITISNKFR